MTNSRLANVPKLKFSWCGALLVALLSLPTAVGAAQDIVLVLDNSSSMTQSDPHFLARLGAIELIDTVADGTHVSTLFFDESVHIAVELTDVNGPQRADLLGSLGQVHYGSDLANIPEALALALKALQRSRESGVSQAIVLLSDSAVATGRAEQDRVKSSWLNSQWVEDAKRSGVRLFAIALTDKADRAMMRSLAEQTGGDYFFAEDGQMLLQLFRRIATMLEAREKGVARQEVAPAPVAQPLVHPTPAVVPQLLPEQQPEKVPEQTRDNTIPLMGWGLLFVLLGSLAAFAYLKLVRPVSVMRFRGSEKRAPQQQAFLYDINSVTSRYSHEVGPKTTVLGRVEGPSLDDIQYLVVARPTIGRRQAIIELKGGSYWISDQNSVNGTYVNGKKITILKRLRHGDRVRLDRYEFEFVVPAQANEEEAKLAAPSVRTVRATVGAEAARAAPLSRPSSASAVGTGDRAAGPAKVTLFAKRAAAADEEITVMMGSGARRKNEVGVIPDISDTSCAVVVDGGDVTTQWSANADCIESGDDDTVLVTVSIPVLEPTQEPVGDKGVQQGRGRGWPEHGQGEGLSAKKGRQD
ncbi:MAG: VWA domain-containing protein [Gammaproteobacteria bacterium]|nr:VWA domain-containing protein [Gammaproteobacteria bacterium]